MQSVEEWCRAYVESTSLEHKVAPPPVPERWADDGVAVSLLPGRPPELEVTFDSPRQIKPGALVNLQTRGRLVHKFWHHELQAAELMAWAVLRFPATEHEFRRGLLRIMRDEIRHMTLYRGHLNRLGYDLGAFPVRDWFWERAVGCESATSFIAFIGMGLEGANLDHTDRFSGWLRLVGDEFGASVLDQVGREEVAHVRFATRWFRTWTGDVDFDEWVRALPPPISPLLLRGKALRRDLRAKAEMPPEFLDRLESWQAIEKRTPKAEEQPLEPCAPGS